LVIVGSRQAVMQPSPKVRVNDRFMLTRMNLSAVRDLTSIKTIGQQAMQGSAREGCTPGAVTGAAVASVYLYLLAT
jgi:hypothetical protein